MHLASKSELIVLKGGYRCCCQSIQRVGIAFFEAAGMVLSVIYIPWILALLHVLAILG